MKKLLLIFLSTILTVKVDGISQENFEIIENFRKGERVVEPSKRKIISLSKVKEKNIPSLREYLFLIQDSKEVDLDAFKRIKKMHNLKTFYSLYGKDAEAVKGFDEHKFYMQAISAKIEKISLKNNEE